MKPTSLSPNALPSSPSPLPPRPPTPRRPLGRWSVVVALVLLGHLAAGAWLALHRTRPAPPAAPKLVEIALLTPTPIAQGGAGASPHANRAASTTPERARQTQGVFQELSRVAPPAAIAHRAATAHESGTDATRRAERNTTDANRAAHDETGADIDEKNAGAGGGAGAGTGAGANTDTDTDTNADTNADAASDPATAGDADNAAATPADTASAVAATASSFASAAVVPGADSGTGASAIVANTASATSASRARPSAGATHGTRFALLPSSDLRYDTFFNGAQNQSGTIRWRTDGRQYELVVSLPLPFVGTYSYTSAGHIDAFGLAPDVYTETRGHRGGDVSRFDRTPPAPHVAFTRTPNSVPLPEGAQDRFSMIFQLASLVRGEPRRYQPGVTREFFVVDDDSGETWPIQTIGPDPVTLAEGMIDAVRFTRLPRHAGDRRRIDVWLAPSLGWLPVRIMQTEPNGTQIELVYHGGSRIVAAHAPALTGPRDAPGGAPAVSTPGGAGPRPDRP